MHACARRPGQVTGVKNAPLVSHVKNMTWPDFLDDVKNMAWHDFLDHECFITNFTRQTDDLIYIFFKKILNDKLELDYASHFESTAAREHRH